MPSFRVVVPALVGLVLLFIGVQSFSRAACRAMAAPKRGRSPTSVAARRDRCRAHPGLARGRSRRSRAGYLLGIADRGPRDRGGLAAIVAEIPYLAEGGLGGALGGGVVVVAVLWIGPVGRLWRLDMAVAPLVRWPRGRAGDRTIGIVLSGVGRLQRRRHTSAWASSTTDAFDQTVAAENRAAALGCRHVR